MPTSWSPPGPCTSSMSSGHPLEQDHRGIKQRYRPMGGFKHGRTTARFCRAFDEVRAFLRPQSRRNQPLSLAQRRDIYQDRFGQLMEMLAADHAPAYGCPSPGAGVRKRR
jgi:putative transposase